MMQTYEAHIDVHGQVRLLEPVRLSAPCRAIVTVLESVPDEGSRALLHFAETALSQDWDRPEEDAAWGHLQPVK
ncbi:MAG: hypothetical protein G8237_01850 [Magnetococcales bacterium]|nr:hypothetical protein [Magnetococcales bacterium]NGZ05077.1 hypothetical protein [Magnetococcales bacterium]